MPDLTKPLSEEEIQQHLATLRMHYDPQSPFQGMVNFDNGLLSLPIPQQHQIHRAMPDDLRAMVFGKKNETS